MSAVREDEHDMYRGEDGYYHFLYRITNKRNGKFYVGIHSTHDLDDGYMGSGTNICQAVKKYGKDSFVREILEFFENRQELSEREKEIVDEEFINRPDTYNIVLGGDSGLGDTRRTSVLLLDLEGNLLREFSSRNETEEHFGQDINYYLNKNRVFREKFFLVSDSKIKLSETAKKKISQKKKTPVKLLDLEGNSLKTFPSRTEVEKHFGQDIGHYLNKNRVFRDKFFLVSENRISETTKKKISEKKKIPVKLLDLEGNLLRKFSSRTEAEDHFGQRIHRYLNKNRVFREKFFLVSENRISETTKKKMSEKKKIQVKLLDLEGNLLREFSSKNEVEKQFGQHIDYYLNKNRVFREKFFLVSDSKTKLSETAKKKLSEKKKTPVKLLDLEGNLLREFSSKNEAENYFGQRIHYYLNKNKIFRDKFFLVSEKKVSKQKTS